MSMPYDESQGDKFLRKAKDQPMLPIGLGGLMCVCAYGAYKYRSRGNMSTSIFLIQMRVAAQGTVIGCLCAGLAYTMVKNHLWNDNSKKE